MLMAGNIDNTKGVNNIRGDTFRSLAPSANKIFRGCFLNNSIKEERTFLYYSSFFAFENPAFLGM